MTVKRDSSARTWQSRIETRRRSPTTSCSVSDKRLTIGVNWALEIETNLRQSDAVIVLDVVRPSDREFHDAIGRRDSIVLVKGLRLSEPVPASSNTLAQA